MPYRVFFTSEYKTFSKIDQEVAIKNTIKKHLKGQKDSVCSLTIEEWSKELEKNYLEQVLSLENYANPL